jgi:hypothetical protein
MMDRYDYLLMDIILTYKRCNGENVRLSALEEQFWKRIETDHSLHIGNARIGERIARLYLDGYIQNKNGCSLTRRGKDELSCQIIEIQESLQTSSI